MPMCDICNKRKAEWKSVETHEELCSPCVADEKAAAETAGMSEPLFEALAQNTGKEKVYTCVACGEVSGTAKDGVVTQLFNGRQVIVASNLWAEKAIVGKEDEIKSFCQSCKEAGELEGMKFAPLRTALSYAQRAKRHFSKRNWLLTESRFRPFEIQMRQPRPEMICVNCGKAHGQINNFDGKVTLITGALPIDRGTYPIRAEFVCQDCRVQIWPMGTKQPRIFAPHDSWFKATAMEAKRQAILAEEAAKLAAWEARQAEINEIKAKAAENRKAEIRQQGLRKPGSTVVYRPGHEPAATPGTGSIQAHHKGRDRKAS